jgi:hypothetical protein
MVPTPWVMGNGMKAGPKNLSSSQVFIVFQEQVEVGHGGVVLGIGGVDLCLYFGAGLVAGQYVVWLYGSPLYGRKVVMIYIVCIAYPGEFAGEHFETIGKEAAGLAHYEKAKRK